MITNNDAAALLDLSYLVSVDNWALAGRIVELATARGLPVAVGGGLAFAAYTAYRCRTKDTDLFLLPRDRQAMIDLATEVGLVDYFDQAEYDPSWIYRGTSADVIVDLIWEMANHRAPVDEGWLTRGRQVQIHGTPVKLIGAEELIWAKLYIVQRDRCDWPDVVKLLQVLGPGLDWDHLFRRVGEDLSLLASVVSLYTWLCPVGARELPPWIWSWMGMAAPEAGPNCDQDLRRVNLLDSRPWFGPNMEDSE
jgi:hypothetical protein